MSPGKMEQSLRVLTQQDMSILLNTNVETRSLICFALNIVKATMIS